MKIRSFAAALSFAVLAIGCGGTTESEYRITRGEEASFVIEHQGESQSFQSGTFVSEEATSGERSVNASMMEAPGGDICCTSCTFRPDGTFSCTGCKAC